MNPVVGCHYFPPGLLSPSQSESITALWPVQNYTSWWQRHMCANNLPRVVTRRRSGQESNSRKCQISIKTTKHRIYFRTLSEDQQWHDWYWQFVTRRRRHGKPVLLLLLLLLLGSLLSYFRSTKAFSFQNRLSLNFAHRWETIFSTIAPCRTTVIDWNKKLSYCWETVRRESMP